MLCFGFLLIQEFRTKSSLLNTAYTLLFHPFEIKKKVVLLLLLLFKEICCMRLTIFYTNTYHCACGDHTRILHRTHTHTTII